MLPPETPSARGSSALPGDLPSPRTSLAPAPEPDRCPPLRVGTPGSSVPPVPPYNFAAPPPLQSGFKPTASQTREARRAGAAAAPREGVRTPRGIACRRSGSASPPSRHSSSGTTRRRSARSPPRSAFCARARRRRRDGAPKPGGGQLNSSRQSTHRAVWPPKRGRERRRDCLPRAPDTKGSVQIWCVV